MFRLPQISTVKVHQKCILRCFHEAKISTAYKPNEVEKNCVEETSLQGLPCKNNGKKFTIILPPPNVTGYLHLGHALMCTIQDVICRAKRLQGYNVTWVPGTDHAGIATQVVVEKKLLKERGLSRHDIGRDKFLNEVWKWKTDKGARIVTDLKKLGATLNWNREYFTMDQIQSNAVNEAFISLFEDGLVHREKALVNWSCSLESTISDIEIENVDISKSQAIRVPNHERPVKFGQIYYISYKLSEGDGEIVVATTRPETLLGDVAIAVHPEDEKYQFLHGKSTKLIHPFRNETIPLIFDESVDREFGTGAVKITPAHDKFDFDLAKRHLLEPIEVVDEKGKISIKIDPFFGLPRFEAREKMLHALANRDLLKGIRPHSMQLPICGRSKDIIEYMLKPQWFLECEGMAQAAIDAVKDGRIKLNPSNYENEWFRWLNDCKTWCISRQLWWGHRIPVYHCNIGGKSDWIPAKSLEEAASKAKRKYQTNDITLEQDTDVLDTWFSSSLLPFSCFNWPNKEYREFYPMDLMETGHDILFFWVARMAMLGLKLTGEVPFKEILLHGIVCDAHGRKMSKSLGNIILPEQVIKGSSLEELSHELHKSFESGAITQDELIKSTAGLKQNFPSGIQECGTDALRFTLCSHNIKARFISFDVSECHTNKLFFNKIWQATRFTLESSKELGVDIKGNYSLSRESEMKPMDKWILTKLSSMIRICTTSIDKYDFHLAISAIKNFFYSNLCDVYLETTKRDISNGSNAGKIHCNILAVCLTQGLQMMSPFTPSLSKELLKHFGTYENFNENMFTSVELEKEVDTILEICSNIRQLKSQNQITRKHEPKIHIFPRDEDSLNVLRKYKDVLELLTMSKEVCFELSKDQKNFTLQSTASHLCSFGITTNKKYEKFSDSLSLNKKKLEKLNIDLSKLTNMISKEGYRKGASTETQAKHLEKIKQIQLEIEAIKNIGT